MVRDENVEAVRDARETLVRKYGGLDGWFRHLQQRDRRRTARTGRKPKTGGNKEVAHAARKSKTVTKLGVAD